MRTGEGRRIRWTRRVLIVTLALLLLPAGPGTARAATYEVYSLTGYEIWYTPTVGTFVGTGTGATGALSAWYTSIEHSVVISPSGTISGGTAALHRDDGVRVTGHFGSGSVVMTNDGPGCTNESHDVVGALYGVTRSDRPGEVGGGFFTATLTHLRAWVFGRCMTYSASVNGTIGIAI